MKRFLALLAALSLEGCAMSTDYLSSTCDLACAEAAAEAKNGRDAALFFGSMVLGLGRGAAS